MVIDYHAHVNFNAYKEDANEVIKRALDGGVFMVLVGSQIDTSRRAVEMAAQYEKGVWASVGLHPIHLEQMEVDEEESHFSTRAEVFDPAAYRALAKNEKVVAIGECGLDYWHPYHKDPQHKTFRQHLDLAHELDLPLILHCRGSVADPEDAYRDMLTILREYVEAGKIARRGSIHCFISTLPIALQFVELGFHVGFTGVITFKGAEKYAEVIRGLPLERILVETDCPYLTPVPHRGKRNEPVYVRYMAEKVAEIKNLDKHTVEGQLFLNTVKVFNKIPASYYSRS